MAVRTTESTVTFHHPFTLTVIDGPLPAGTYRLVVDDEELLDLSFAAFRRTATMLHVPAIAVAGGTRHVFLVDQGELTAALEADGRI
ncbi:MAG: hypothetical protein IT561_28315 [Alphaproteobacteria bacterium]|nr:hypothetical protein [Alphaproteobacteria bacterium]